MTGSSLRKRPAFHRTYLDEISSCSTLLWGPLCRYDPPGNSSHNSEQKDKWSLFGVHGRLQCMWFFVVTILCKFLAYYTVK